MKKPVLRVVIGLCRLLMLSGGLLFWNGISVFSSTPVPLNEEFQNMIEHHGSMMMVMESDTGAIVYANPAAERFYGYEPGAMPGLNIQQFNMLSPSEVAAEMAAAREQERNYFQFQHRLADGSIRHVEVFSYPYRLNDREVLFSIIHDVTQEVVLNERNALLNRVIQFLLGGLVLTLTLATVQFLRDGKKQAERTRELQSANAQHQLLLDSTAEAICGIDPAGNLTFFNQSFLHLTGFDSGGLVGKNLHALLQHSRPDGTPLPEPECKMLHAIAGKQTIHEEGEVLWRVDGTPFEAEYHATPQVLNGEVVGAVISFTDRSERNRAAREIIYLSYHDALTGLYNRRYFEQELDRLDQPRNLPLCVLMGDVNGLKLANDTFGHEAGDQLLRDAANILKQACRADDILARWGGDEFAILLPSTSMEEAETVIRRIQDLLANVEEETVRVSIALGAGEKTKAEEPIHYALGRAEDAMYEQKALERGQLAKETISLILKKLTEQCPWEKQHAEAVSQLCAEMCSAMDVEPEQSRRLEYAGLVHDIGMVAVDKGIREKPGPLTEHEWQQVRKHPAIGYRILSVSEETMDLAEVVFSHHERWDGSGYPQGLSGDRIPLLSRLLALAESFHSMTSKAVWRSSFPREAALQEIRMCAGSQFDPKLAERFCQWLERSAHS